MVGSGDILRAAVLGAKLRPAPPCSGLGQGPKTLGGCGFLSRPYLVSPPTGSVPTRPLAPAHAYTEARARALLEGGRCVVGALGGRCLCWGIMVVHHGGDAVAYGSLVAPARRDGRWHRALGGGEQVALGGSAHGGVSKHPCQAPRTATGPNGRARLGPGKALSCEQRKP